MKELKLLDEQVEYLKFIIKGDLETLSETVDSDIQNSGSYNKDDVRSIAVAETILEQLDEK